MASKNPILDAIISVTTEAMCLDSMQRCERMIDMWTAHAPKEDDAEFAAHADRLFAPLLIIRQMMLDDPDLSRRFMNAAPNVIGALEKNPSINMLKDYRRDKGKAARQAQAAVDAAFKGKSDGRS